MGDGVAGASAGGAASARLAGKVAIVTGAGRGLGRAEAMLLAAQGAAVVVNDPGVSLEGTGDDDGPAAAVVREIEALGGRAVASRADCADWDGAKSLVDLAVSAFGRLDILVNSAGILRDRMSFNMGQADWDAVVRVHLTGTFAPSRFAAEHWREASKRGERVAGRIVNTTSEAGLMGTVGQTNYTAAKAGVAAMTVSMARELGRYGVTVNAISPRAKTRLSVSVNGTDQPDGPDDPLSPDNVAPLVVYLAGDDAAHINGQVILLIGPRLELWKTWQPVASLEREGRWDVDRVRDGLAELFDGHSSVPERLPWEDEPAASS
jgi:NAD(P)-dependent dehydrogenase (short-subunit alcohol dehydrogenase family)